MTDQEILESLLGEEQQWLTTHRELYLECLNNKLLKDRKTDLEIRDGLILFWHVFRSIVDNR
jgi:hypothetical protein